MVHMTRGILLSSDPTTKELLLHFDKRKRFVLADVDDSHLVADMSVADWLQSELDSYFQENVFVPAELNQAPAVTTKRPRRS
mmetsp:Transcript_32046/g.80419  ORF Transcript_32046/g.80419 Transcript_32046/m.80419 type:complete len:82 (+) Transcript_32046:94-339(+)